MRLAVEVMHGVYMGDVCASVYEKGSVRLRPEILEACRRLGVEAVMQIREARSSHGHHWYPSEGDDAR